MEALDTSQLPTKVLISCVGVRPKHVIKITNEAKAIKEIDRIVDSSLRQLAADKHVHAWCAKERDWVNYFAHRYLIKKCSKTGPLKKPWQIGIEVGVPQPPPYNKPSVSRDLVIWPDPGDTCWKGNRIDRPWAPAHHPLAILEWKVHRFKHPNRMVTHEREWLEAYCQKNKSVLAYAIEIDGRCSPRTMVCTRFYGNAKPSRWLELSF
jgi:hypothetical protein